MMILRSFEFIMSYLMVVICYVAALVANTITPDITIGVSSMLGLISVFLVIHSNTILNNGFLKRLEIYFGIIMCLVMFSMLTYIYFGNQQHINTLTVCVVYVQTIITVEVYLALRRLVKYSLRNKTDV